MRTSYEGERGCRALLRDDQVIRILNILTQFFQCFALTEDARHFQQPTDVELPVLPKFSVNCLRISTLLVTSLPREQHCATS